MIERRAPRLVMAAWLAGVAWSCTPGGDTPIGNPGGNNGPTGVTVGLESPPTAAPTARPATATPTTAPAATATPNPEAILYPGPVRFVSIKVFSARGEGGLREPPFEDQDGNQVVYLGETVVFDATPKNERNQQCEWEDPPTWYIEDNLGNISQLASSNPFLLRVNIVGRTAAQKRVHVFAEVDRVLSNHLFIVIK